MLAMGDALAMAVLQARGFKQKDFARLHPSGAIGRAMLLTVGDIMRTGDRNAVADENLTVKEALLVMTRAKSGSVERGQCARQTGRRFHRRRFAPAHGERRESAGAAA